MSNRKEYMKQYLKEYYQKNKKRIRERNDAWEKKNKNKPSYVAYKREAQKRCHCKRTYGITLDKKHEMLKYQKGKCYICKKDISKKAYVDHNHSRKQVRALLCCQCNAAIGMIHESPEIAIKIADYIEYFNNLFDRLRSEEEVIIKSPVVNAAYEKAKKDMGVK